MGKLLELDIFCNFIQCCYFVLEWNLQVHVTFLDFFHRPVFYRTENTTFRKKDLFPSSGEGGEDTYSVVQWLRLALSKGPNWVGVFSPFTWGRKQIQFPKRCVFYSLENRTMGKMSKNPVILCYTPSVNPLESESNFCYGYLLLNVKQKLRDFQIFMSTTYETLYLPILN
jgi:hypothetical protein